MQFHRDFDEQQLNNIKKSLFALLDGIETDKIIAVRDKITNHEVQGKYYIWREESKCFGCLLGTVALVNGFEAPEKNYSVYTELVNAGINDYLPKGFDIYKTSHKPFESFVIEWLPEEPDTTNEWGIWQTNEEKQVIAWINEYLEEK